MFHRVLPLTLLFVFVLLLSISCGSSEESVQGTVQAAIVATQETAPTATPTAVSTKTPTPTDTPSPTDTPDPTAAIVGRWKNASGLIMDLRADGGGALILSDGTGGEVQWDISDEGLCVHAESISTSECFEYQLDGDRLEIGEAVYQRQDATIPIQTTTPKPTLIPTPAPEPILLSGSGDSIIDIEK